MAVYGQLSTMSLMDLLQWAGLNRQNGVFELERNKISKKLLFSGGKVVACYTNDPQSRLGQFLLSRSKIDREQLQDALRRQQATGESLGAILLDLSLITELELTSLMSQKAEEMILSLFDWQEAIFRFEEKGSLGPYVIEVDLTVDDILLKGLQRVDELSIIRRVFPDSGLVLGLTGKTIPQEVESSSMASRIVKAVNGERTIAEVMLHTNSSDFLVLKFLYNLFNRGVLQIMGRREPGETVTIVDPWRKQADNPQESFSLDMLDGPLAEDSQADSQGAPAVGAGAQAVVESPVQENLPPAESERSSSIAAARLDDVLGGLSADGTAEPLTPAHEEKQAAIDDAPRFEIDDPFAAAESAGANAAADESAESFSEDSSFVVAGPVEAHNSMEKAIDRAANIFVAHDSLQSTSSPATEQDAPRDEQQMATALPESDAPHHEDSHAATQTELASPELADESEQTDDSIQVEAVFTPHAEAYESEPAPSEADFKFELDGVAQPPASSDSGFADLGNELADTGAEESFAKLDSDTPTPSEDQAAEAVRQLAIQMEETLTIVPWSEKPRDPVSAQDRMIEDGRLVDLRSGLETAKQFMSRSEYNKALDVLNKCYIDHPDDAHLKDMIAKAESGYMSKAADRGLGGGAIPKRTQRALGQNEAQLPQQSSYLFSMIDGVTEIRALYWLAPMREVEVLRILDRLRDLDLVELIYPVEESSEPSLAPQPVSGDRETNAS